MKEITRQRERGGGKEERNWEREKERERKRKTKKEIKDFECKISLESNAGELERQMALYDTGGMK